MKTCPSCQRCFSDETPACPDDASVLEPGLAGPLLIDGTYAIERRLGQGGMGVVFRARHVAVDRAFALKLMRGHDPDAPEFVARFRAEAAALGRLKHPAIVDVTDFGIDPREGGVPYLVMEYLEGQSLSERCRDGGRLGLDEALPILTALADAIDFAHERGVLHRDLKPANVLLEQGEAGTAVRAKVLDFGLARLEERSSGAAREGKPAAAALPDFGRVTGTAATMEVSVPSVDAAGATWSTPAPADGRFTSSGQLAGTLSYMAPELLRGGAATRASDLYAFGVLAYEVLVGRRPAIGTPEEVIEALLLSAPTLPSVACPDLPAGLDGPIVAALAKDPALRPATAREYVRGLARAVRAARRQQWRRREVPRRLALAAVLGVAATAAAGALAATSVGKGLERRTVDARFSRVALRPPHPSLALVVLDEASLRADTTPLAQRADEFARRVEGLFAAGARAVALDFILPPTWTRSPALSRALLRHADAMALAAIAAPGGEVTGPESVAGLTAVALGEERTSALFGLTNLVTDEDGVVRRARLRYPTTERGRLDSLALRGAVLLGRLPPPAAPEVFWLDHTADWPHAPRTSWADLDLRLRDDPGRFRNRLVLVGGDFVGSGDGHRLPARKGAAVEVPGVVLQGLIADTILSGFPYREGGTPVVRVVGGVAAAALAAALLCLWSLRPGLIAAALLGAAAVAAPLLAFGAGVILPLLPPLGSLLLAMAGALVLRARLPGIPSLDETE